MRGFRAKDDDRDRYVELIEAAFAGGEIGDADRELRVVRAQAAESLDELETLTRDLQRRQGSASPTAPTQRSTQPPSRSRRAGGVLVGLVVFVVLVVGGVTGVVALAMFAVPGERDSVFSQGTEVAPVPVEEVSEGASFRMTAPQVRQFLKAYEKKFGTLDAFEVTFFPDRIQAQVPVRGPRPRMERWTWDGQWRQDTTAAAVTGPLRRVDAGSIDVRRMFANIDVAERGLEVEKARFTHAILLRWNEEPTELNIYVANTFDESGHLSTTPAGQVRRRHPYEP